jgi:D-lactate dehydrogenase (cytochrome)
LIEIDQHSHDESYHRTRAPDAVVFPTSTAQVADVAKYCYEHELPIIPFGLGSGFEGGITAPTGGISVSMAKMNSVVKINHEDFIAVVQPGVSRLTLNEYIR